VKYWITLASLTWLVIFPAWLSAQNLPRACGGSKVRYTVKGLENSVFHWDVKGGTIFNNNNSSVDIQWDNNEGIHEISVTQYNPLGCTGSPVYGYILVYAPKLNLEENVNICEGETYTLKANANYQSILWNTGSTDSSIIINKAGYYKAEVTFSNGCVAQDSTLLIVYPQPVFSLGKDTMACKGETITLNPDIPGVTYQWSTGETSPSVIVNANVRTVWLKLTNNYGCAFTDSIRILPCSENALKELVPNAFTPNNDNDNDTWRIDILVNYPDASVSIFNRWGQAVYKTDKYPSQGWDGTSSGRPLPMDTYFYIIDLKNGTKPILGSLNLIR
jgi:gliding motility-associated-like protein